MMPGPSMRARSLAPGELGLAVASIVCLPRWAGLFQKIGRRARAASGSVPNERSAGGGLPGFFISSVPRIERGSNDGRGVADVVDHGDVVGMARWNEVAEARKRDRAVYGRRVDVHDQVVVVVRHVE